MNNSEFVLTDLEKLIIIFLICILFAGIMLIIFYWWRIYRRDRLANNPSIEDITQEESMKLKLDQTFDKKYFIELANLKSHNQIKNSFSQNNYKYRKNIIIPHSLDDDLFGWWSFCGNFNENQLLNLLNTEGYMYLYFLKSTYYFLLLISCISIFIILPINIYNDEFISIREQGSTKKLVDKLLKNSTDTTLNNTVQLDFLTSMTAKNIYNSDNKIYIILILSYLITFLAYYYVYNYKKKLDSISRNEEYNKRIYDPDGDNQDIVDDSIDNDVSTHSIHIREINRNLSYKETLKLLSDYFNMRFFNEVLSIQVVPNYDKIIGIIDRRYHYECELNKTQFFNFNKPERLKARKTINGCNVDLELYYRNKIIILERLIDFYRKLLVRKNTGNAFICFKNPNIVKNILENKEKFIFSNKDTLHGTLLGVKNWNVKKAPLPSDIIWQNIKYSKRNRIFKMYFFTFVLFFVFLYLVTPKEVKFLK